MQIIPALAAGVTAVGLGTLAWFRSLPAADQQAANARAEGVARELVGKAVGHLTGPRAEAVARRLAARLT